MSDDELLARIVLGAEPGGATDSYTVYGLVPALDEIVRHLWDLGYKRACWEPVDVWSDEGRDQVRTAVARR